MILNDSIGHSHLGLVGEWQFRAARSHRLFIDSNEQEGLAINIMSGWEVANLVQKNRLTLNLPVFRLD